MRDTNKIYYVCNRMKCYAPDVCPNHDCEMTSDKRFRKDDRAFKWSDTRYKFVEVHDENNS